MTRRTLREQLVEDWARTAASDERAAIVAARIRESIASAQSAAPAAPRSRGRRRGWLVAGAAVIAVAASVVALVATRRAGDAQARVLAASEAWLGFEPVVPAGLEGWRLVGLRREVVDGAAGVRLDLVDGRGRSAVVVEAQLRDVGAAAGARGSAEGLRVELSGTTMTARREGDLLVASAEPSDAEPMAGTVRRSGDAVVLTRADGLEETTMTNVHSRDAASRLARAALAALALTTSVPTMAAEPPGAPGAPVVAAPARPELLAVKFHADWCPVCRKMGTIFDDLARQLEDQPVQFVELDMTDDSTRRQASYLAAALGIDDVAREQGTRVGVIVLVDADTREVVGRLNGDLTLDELARGTREAMGRL